MSHILARDLDSPCVLLGIALLWSIMLGFQMPHQSYFSLQVPKKHSTKQDVCRVSCFGLTAVCATCSLGASAHPKAHELVYLRQVEPLSGGGAANFGSGATNLFPGSSQN